MNLKQALTGETPGNQRVAEPFVFKWINIQLK